MIPHVTDEITSRIQRVAQEPTDGTGLQPHVCLIELGGTVGDIESMVFLESLRMLRYVAWVFQVWRTGTSKATGRAYGRTGVSTGKSTGKHPGCHVTIFLSFLLPGALIGFQKS